MTTITVSSQAEAQSAYLQLAANGGGTILLAAGAEPYKLELKGDLDDGNNAAIEIRPEDPNGDLNLSRLWMRDVENVTVRNVRVDTSELLGSETGRNFEIRNVDNVRILDSTFKSRATDYYDVSHSEDEKADIFGSIYDSSNVEFSGNSVSNYFQGLGIFESTDVVISGNEISEMQGDGIRMAGVQRLTIEGNYIHDFYGAPNNVNHDDMIQMWSANAKLVSGDISIIGNVLNSGIGQATQSIFIGNERDGDDPTHVYQNVTISDNLIINGHNNGIVLSAARNGVVENNTLLWNSASKMYSTGEDYANDTGENLVPGIRTPRVEGGSVSGNVAGAIYSQAPILGENKIVTFTDQVAANYVGEHFLNDSFDGVTSVGDFRLAIGSDLAGSGSSLTQVRSQTEEGVDAVLALSAAPDDFNHIIFDARYSIDTEGYLDGSDDFLWTFSDGTTATGIVVEKTFAEGGDKSVSLEVVRNDEVVDKLFREFSIADKLFAKMDFEDGVVDLSGYENSLGDVNTDNLFKSGDNQAYRIGGSQKLSLSRGNDQIHNLETFGLRLDMQLANVATSGTFLYFHKVFQGSISEDGIVKFKIITDEGTYSVSSDRALFQDGQAHTLGIGFDGVNGALELVYDGETVGEGEAHGVTAGKTSFGIVFGHSFSNALPATIDNFLLHADPAEAGVTIERETSSFVEEWAPEDMTQFQTEDGGDSSDPQTTPSPSNDNNQSIISNKQSPKIDTVVQFDMAEISLEEKYLEPIKDVTNQELNSFVSTLASLFTLDSFDHLKNGKGETTLDFEKKVGLFLTADASIEHQSAFTEDYISTL
jgi:nitrous oxidase accessory protein NosD